MPIDATQLLEFLGRQARRPLTVREILRHFRLPREERQDAVELLEKLAREGTLAGLKGGRYSLPAKINLVTGTLSVHRDGYGFVAPSTGSGPDVFVPARFLREAMHGDRVVVRVERGGGRPEGRLVRVLDRAHQTVVGRYERGAGFGFVVPADRRLQQDIFIPEGAASDARPGQVVVARLDTFPSKNRGPAGVVVEVLGDPNDPAVEILSIVHQHGLPDRFPAEVLKAAEEVSNTVLPEDLKGREDLRELPFVTIDGETAKDFDDAVAVRSEGEGLIRLWVAIADVGHYVPEGGLLDREALTRGTSVYFPGRCIPMLPEPLSNGICSLNPRVDRLTLVAEMLFDAEGERRESRFYPAVIRSCARLTYTLVFHLLEGGALEDPDVPSTVPADLERMKELALRLMAMRRRRGSLDFDLPEAEVVLDLTGRTENIVRTVRTLAHRLIEEFMLAANEAVASFLTDRQAPHLYRVHEPPSLEKLQAFQGFLAHFNYGLTLSGDGVSARELQALLSEVEGKPEERMINQVLLRSMKQAHYDPENLGHFGLAAERYCHFTSPIRRYPDLVVHRVLREVLSHGGRLPAGRRADLERRLPGIGEQTSALERRAMEAERQVIDLKKCQFMADRVGEEFPGFVSGVQAFGFFVELAEFFVEGLVHISSLEDDFYHFEEERHRLVGESRRRVFQIGDPIRVRVKNVSTERREIDFALAGEPSAPARRRTRSPRGGRKKSR